MPLFKNSSRFVGLILFMLLCSPIEAKPKQQNTSSSFDINTKVEEYNLARFARDRQYSPQSAICNTEDDPPDLITVFLNNEILSQKKFVADQFLVMKTTPQLKGVWEKDSAGLNDDMAIWTLTEQPLLGVNYQLEIQVVDPASKKVLNSKKGTFKFNAFKWCGIEPVKIDQGKLFIRFHFNSRVDKGSLLKNIQIKIANSVKKVNWLEPNPSNAPIAEMPISDEEKYDTLSFTISEKMPSVQSRARLGKSITVSQSLVPMVGRLVGYKNIKIPIHLLKKAKFDPLLCKKPPVVTQEDNGTNNIEPSSCYYDGHTTEGNSPGESRQKMIEHLCKNKIPLLSEFLICINELWET